MKHLLPCCLTLLPSLVACTGSYEEVQEMSDEERLDLYQTTAQFLYEDDSLDRAEEQALKGLELDEDNVPLRRMLGWIGLRRGRNQDNDVARGIFRELIDEGDDSAATRLGLAISLERLGLAYDESAAAVEAGTRKPDEGRTAAETAETFRARSRELWRESLASYEETLTGGEGSTASMNGLQRVHALLGEYEQSLEWSERLLERSQAELVAWQDILTSADLNASEEQLFQDNEVSAYELQKDTHLFQATILHRMGRDEEAYLHLDEAIELAPDIPQLYSLRAQLARQLGRYEAAVEDIQHYLRTSELPFESPEIQRAFELLTECEDLLRTPAGA